MPSTAILGLVGLVLIAVVCLWLILVPLLQAYADFKARPREPMDWCPKHGMFRQQHSLPVPGVPTVKMCPTCFLNSISKAGKAL